MIDALILAAIYIAVLAIGRVRHNRKHRAGHLPPDFWKQ